MIKTFFNAVKIFVLAVVDAQSELTSKTAQSDTSLGQTKKITRHTSSPHQAVPTRTARQREFFRY